MNDPTSFPHFKNRIYLIRHGETEWSRSKKHTGRTDIPLTSEGEKEAVSLKKALAHVHFEKVFVSPLKRALDTCKLAGYLDRATEADELYEVDYGNCEGISTADIRKTQPGWSFFGSGVKNGETFEDLAKRADSILEKAKKISGNVAFFSSGHISRIIAARWIGQDPRFGKHLKLSTASISILDYEHEWTSIGLWNDTSHLSHLK